MIRLPANLPTLLRRAGLTVVELPGWQQRGRPASTGTFAPVGVLHHHTGGPSNGGRPYAEGVLTHGRADLPGPLCHLSTDRDGVVYVVAAGRANHAGQARQAGSVAAGDGNTLYVGVENQNTGTEGWTPEQMRAMRLLTAVLLDLLHSSANTVHGHYETSTEGKWDPGDPHGVPFKGHRVLDMGQFRASVTALSKKPPSRASVTALSKKPPSRVARARVLLQQAYDHAAVRGKKRATKIAKALRVLPPE